MPRHFVTITLDRLRSVDEEGIELADIIVVEAMLRRAAAFVLYEQNRAGNQNHVAATSRDVVGRHVMTATAGMLASGPGSP